MRAQCFGGPSGASPLPSAVRTRARRAYPPPVTTSRPPLPTIAIAGASRLGGALAVALHRAGYPVVAVASRREEPARALLDHLGPPSGGRPQPLAFATTSWQAAADAADLVLLTLADGAIAEVCARIRWRPGQAAVHCSGVRPLDVLATASETGALAGCLHPLQSFPRGAADAARFDGITFGIEAPDPLAPTLEAIAHALHARTVRLEGVDRALYHVAAILASNNVVALAAAAQRAWTLAGLPLEAANAALGPLTLTVATNVAAHDILGALTGPIARGDVTTIERHLDALATTDPALHALYRALASEILRLPLDHTPEVTTRLHALLD